MTHANLPDRNQYIREVIRLYLSLPETASRVGRSDRRLANLFFDRRIDLQTLRQALLLASIRRLGRAPEMPPLPPIRSLHYFLPVIEEVLQSPLAADYVEYLKRKLRTLSASTRKEGTVRPAPVQKSALLGDR